MVSTGVPPLDRLLGGDGYLDRSAILLVGPTGKGKERVLYRFVRPTASGDCSVYVTRSQVQEVVRDARANGTELGEGVVWVAGGGGQLSCDVENLAGLSYSLKDLLKKNAGREVRIVFDVLSSVLMRNPPDGVYKFLDQLIAEAKQHHSVLVATIEEEMFPPQVVASMEQLFDGVMSVGFQVRGGRALPVLEVRKMKGVALPPDAAVMLEGGEAGPAGREDGALDRRRIAVLPFANISPDANDEYFADGLTEELIGKISQVKGLEVIARTSAMAFKTTEKKVSEIAGELRVGTVVGGSVRKSGDRVRVIAQLIDAGSEAHIWSSSYDRNLEDIFAVQSDIAEKVADSLKVKLLPGEKEAIGRAPTKSAEAHALYLKGMSKLHGGTEETYMTGLGYFQQAIQRDPGYALAYVGMARIYLYLGVQEMMPSAEANSKQEEMARKALELDGSLPEAHVALGEALAIKFDFAGGREEVGRALELNPNLASAHFSATWPYLFTGEFDRAVEEMQRALELDPLSLEVIQGLGSVYSTVGETEKAEALYRKALEMDPGSSVTLGGLGVCHVREGRHEEGIAEIRKAMAMSSSLDPDRHGELIWALAKAGRTEEARKALSDMLKLFYEKGRVAYYFCYGYKALGDLDRALEWLETSYERRSGGVHGALVDFDELRPNPRFQALLKKLNLAPRRPVS